MSREHDSNPFFSGWEEIVCVYLWVLVLILRSYSIPRKEKNLPFIILNLQRNNILVHMSPSTDCFILVLSWINKQRKILPSENVSFGLFVAASSWTVFRGGQHSGFFLQSSEMATPKLHLCRRARHGSGSNISLWMVCDAAVSLGYEKWWPGC